MTQQKGGLILKLRADERSLNPHCVSRHRMDCAAMQMAYFGLKPELVEQLQDISIGQGVSPELVTQVLRMTGNSGKVLGINIDIKLVKLTPFKVTKLEQMLEPGEAVILAGFRAGSHGHVFIYGKDIYGNLVIIDNQKQLIFRGTFETSTYYIEQGFTSAGVFLATSKDDRNIFVHGEGLSRRNLMLFALESYETLAENIISELISNIPTADPPIKKKYKHSISPSRFLRKTKKKSPNFLEKVKKN